MNAFSTKLVVFACFLAVSYPLRSQFIIDSSYCYGGTNWETSVCMTMSDDGHTYLGFSTGSADGDVEGNYGNSDTWIAKINPSGTIVWKTRMGGSLDEYPNSILCHSNGSVYVLATTTSNDMDVTGHHGMGDIWLVKLDSNGNFLWGKCIGGSDDEWAAKIIETTDGNLLLAGVTRSSDFDISGYHFGEKDHGLTFDGLAVKVSPDGDILWQKCYGGSGDDFLASAIEISPGSYRLIGHTFSNDFDISGNHGEADILVLDTDGSGNIQSQKCIGGSNGEIAQDACHTLDEGIFIAGGSSSSDGDASENKGLTDGWIIKLNNSNDIEWEKSLGGINYDNFNSIKPLPNGGAIASGFTYSNNGDVSGNHGQNDAWVVELDASSVLLRQICLGGGGQENGHDIGILSDSRIMIACEAYSNDGDVSCWIDGQDAWLVVLTTPVYGCLYPNACNYNPEAVISDNSCTFPQNGFDCSGNCINDDNQNGICDNEEIWGCVYPDATNYSPIATADNGSCIFACPGDLLTDGIVNVYDLLLFLSYYGSTCDYD